MSCRSRRRRVLAAALLSVALLAGRSWAGTVRGNISYRGELGPVGSRRPLCLCVFTDANLLNSIGCLIFRNNDVAYNLNLGNRDYYLIAFLDLQINEVLDPNEPFEIFAGRGAPPADPVAGESGRTDIDFTFGDENLPGTPTSSPTVTATSSYTPTSTRTQTQTRTAASSSTPTVEPTPTSTCAMPDAPACACVGDCDGDGRVAVNELVTAVRVALGIADASACVAGDANRDGVTQIGELVTAVRRSLTGC